ncbi:F-box protein 18 (helicase) [Roseateles asaccharophilus]|uniref:UvrD-helicase domain-containing protein n=1 Tax=Roseateles asaccharophilus TaxID=582607 RepID=UPI003832633B
MTKTLIPTPELKAIVNSRARLLVVKAFAGTGKTTALTVFAGMRKKARILYLAYNKPIQEEAAKRFPKHVDCFTTHGLAFRDFGSVYQAAGKLGNVRPGDVMAALRLDASTAKSVLDVVNTFIYSPADEISGDHIAPNFIGNPDLVLDRARDLWEAMQSLPGEPGYNERINMPHDGYFKLYALSKPDLSQNYDIVFMDEAQDSNDVCAQFVLGQNCIRVLVGDEHQSIYRYRGSTDALEKAAAMPGAEVFHLTTSYRFGHDVSALATALLAGFKGEALPLHGHGKQKSINPKVNKAEPYTVICRTNAKVFATAAALLGKKTIGFVGGVKNYPFDRLVDVQNLAVAKLGAVRDPFLRQLGSLEALTDYVKHTADLEYGALLGIQKEYGARIPALVAQITEAASKFDVKDCEEKPMVELTTAHRSKGLERRQVELADDFEDFVTEAGHPRELMGDADMEELNLLYVAATRASHALQVNPSIARALSALGQTDFCFPEGTEYSPWVESLMDSKIVVRQELLSLPVARGDDDGMPDLANGIHCGLGDAPSIGALAARESYPRSIRP